MRKLTKETKEHIEESVGLPFDELVRMPLSDITTYIEKRIGKKLKITGLHRNQRKKNN